MVLWFELEDLSADILYQEGRAVYRQTLQDIEEAIGERRAYFAYLNRIIADRNADIDSILTRLRLGCGGTNLVHEPSCA